MGDGDVDEVPVFEEEVTSTVPPPPHSAPTPTSSSALPVTVTMGTAVLPNHTHIVEKPVMSPSHEPASTPSKQVKPLPKGQYYMEWVITQCTFMMTVIRTICVCVFHLLFV